MDPHTTKVPAEKKLINRDNPLIHQGTAPPPAKKDLMLVPVRENKIPVTNTITENISMVQISMESKGAWVNSLRKLSDIEHLNDFKMRKYSRKRFRERYRFPKTFPKMLNFSVPKPHYSYEAYNH